MADEQGNSGNPKEKLKEGISKIQSQTKKFKSDVKESIESETNYHIYSALGYIPIIGWMIPYFFKRKSDDCQFHAKQSVALAFMFIVVMTLVWILNNLPILSNLLSWIGINKFIIPAITYTSSVLYLGVAAFSAYKAYSNLRWEVPFLPQIREFLANLFKNELGHDEKNKKAKPK